MKGKKKTEKERTNFTPNNKQPGPKTRKQQ